jgi:hypothetical protein
MTIRVRSNALQRQILLSVLEEEAGDPGEGSMAARALHSACEFWATVSNGTLGQYLGTSPAVRLRYAAIVFQAMGATGVAHTIYEALAELSRTVSPSQREHCVRVLQERLLVSVDPLHDLISRLTQRVH